MTSGMEYHMDLRSHFACYSQLLSILLRAEVRNFFPSSNIMHYLPKYYSRNSHKGTTIFKSNSLDWIPTTFYTCCICCIAVICDLCVLYYLKLPTIVALCFEFKIMRISKNWFIIHNQSVFQSENIKCAWTGIIG